MQEITEKKKYELWREYLLESKAYKAYCGSKRKKRKDSEEKLPSMEMRMTFDFFGDVFENSFENWWKNRKDKDPGIGVIQYDKQQANYEINVTAKEIIRSKGPDLSLDEFVNEFKERLTERLFDHLPASFLIRVHFHPAKSTKELTNQFGKILKEKRSQPDILHWETEFKKGWLPIVGRFRYDELKRYLDVYRLKESGMKMDDILEKMDPDITRNKEDFYQDIRHAKTIIKNIEEGCFPGDYYIK